MKRALFLCISGLFHLAIAQDLRIINTNLYDFSKAGHGIYYLGNKQIQLLPPRPGGAKNLQQATVTMQIVKVFPKSVQIEVNTASHHWVEDAPPRLNTIAEKLDYLDRFGMAENNDGSIRKLLPDETGVGIGIPSHEEETIKTTTIYLLNYPNTNSSTIDCSAIQAFGITAFHSPEIGLITNIFIACFLIKLLASSNS